MSKTYINYSSEVTRYRSAFLPHWELDNGLYFITICLADALPRPFLDKKRRELARELERVASSEADKGRDELGHHFYLDQIDSYLDTRQKDLLLAEPGAAEIVEETLSFWDGERYELYCWVIMGNHIHVLLRLFEGKALRRVYHSWKSYTATKINELLGRKGQPFWHRDNYDHIVRTVEEFERTYQYILNNPSAAGLDNWDWVEEYPERCGHFLTL